MIFDVFCTNICKILAKHIKVQNIKNMLFLFFFYYRKYPFLFTTFNFTMYILGMLIFNIAHLLMILLILSLIGLWFIAIFISELWFSQGKNGTYSFHFFLLVLTIFGISVIRYGFLISKFLTLFDLVFLTMVLTVFVLIV